MGENILFYPSKPMSPLKVESRIYIKIEDNKDKN